jgi:carbon monoxide dehydrogenase subunit G
MSEGTASIVINRPADEVWAAIADITRMGEWSPECTDGRWAGGSTGPAVGATFEGDNELKIAGRTLKKWTTTSEVTGCESGRLFEFVAEHYTTWRYQLEPVGSGTRVTESFSYASKGIQGFIGDTVIRRPASMVKGMKRTLTQLKDALEHT